MATTSRLNITEMVVGQSGGENLFNTALRTLDANVNLTAISQVNNSVSTTAGDLHLVTNGGTTGNFSGKDNQIAYYDQGWKFIVADEGMVCYLQDVNSFVEFDGSTWIFHRTSHLNIEHKTGAYTVLTSDSGKVFTNKGAGSFVVFSLPLATVGLHYTFKVMVAQEIRLDPQAGEQITDPADGVLASAGEYITANALTEFIHIACFTATEWDILEVSGTWAEETP